MIDLYINEGPKIFHKSIFHQAEEWALGGAKFSADGIENALNKYFGITTLAEALTNVMIPTYDIEQRTPVFFKSWNEKEDGFYLMKQLARATSAAPTFFVPDKLPTATGSSGFIDGGLIANNPAMAGLVECRRYSSDLDTYFMVSLGTGKYQRIYHYDDAVHWRPIDWIRPIIDICMDGASATTDYELLQLSRRKNALQQDILDYSRQRWRQNSIR
jgi:patatin-like phospholipase/acyl hydrolase